jgi:hypothetical protein
MGAPTYNARWPAVRKSKADTRALTIESVLSAPYPDLAGDIVEPAGLNFATHAKTAVIDLEHRRHPGVRDAVVAWARPSLRKAGPYHHPIPTRLNFNTDESPEWHTVPVGTEWYDPDDQLSMQVFALCEQDALPGRSLEFTPRGVAKARGWSALENRKAYTFPAADVHCWTVCAQPVCDLAYQAVRKSVPQVPQADAILRVLTDKRVRVGGFLEVAHPTLLKALSAHAPATKRTTVRVEQKAMDDEMDQMPADGTESALEAETQGPEDAAPASNGVTAMLAHVQAVSESVDKLEADLASSDNPQLIADGKRAADQTRKLLTKISATAEKHDAKIQAAMGGQHSEPDGDEGADATETDGDGDSPLDDGYEPDDEAVEKALARDDEGVLVNVPRGVYRKALKGKRFTSEDFKKGQEPVPDPFGESAEYKAAVADFRKWQKHAGKK